MQRHDLVDHGDRQGRHGPSCVEGALRGRQPQVHAARCCRLLEATAAAIVEGAMIASADDRARDDAPADERGNQALWTGHGRQHAGAMGLHGSPRHECPLIGPRFEPPTPQRGVDGSVHGPMGPDAARIDLRRPHRPAELRELGSRRALAHGDDRITGSHERLDRSAQRVARAQGPPKTPRVFRVDGEQRKVRSRGCQLRDPVEDEDLGRASSPSDRLASRRGDHDVHARPRERTRGQQGLVAYFSEVVVGRDDASATGIGPVGVTDEGDARPRRGKLSRACDGERRLARAPERRAPNGDDAHPRGRFEAPADRPTEQRAGRFLERKHVEGM